MTNGMLYYVQGDTEVIGGDLDFYDMNDYDHEYHTDYLQGDDRGMSLDGPPCDQHAEEAGGQSKEASIYDCEWFRN